MPDYDIAIIGGGASGLAAAISAGRTGASAVIIERLPRVGKKLLSTGNGRCNFTNRALYEGRYRGSVPPVLDGFDTEEFMRSLGVLPFADSEGRVYPMSGNASAVLDALRMEAKRLSVRELCGFAVKEIRPGKQFTLLSDSGSVTAKSVIIAGGGMSQSALGSDGSALRLLKALGVRCTPLQPALVPLKTKPELLRGLKGVRAAANAALLKGGKPYRSERGEVQFTENALSGICVFNLSLWYDEGERAEISLDFMPDFSESNVLSELKALQKIRAEAALEDFLTGIVHKRVGILLIRNFTGKQPSDNAGALSESDLSRLAHGLKNMKFPVTGTAGFERSQVTRGGVIADELDENFALVKHPKMYVCGEAVDVAGECGGFNLAFAFASGYRAGKAAAEAVK